MKLHRILEDRKSQLTMQQDFIDVFPDSWSFKLNTDMGVTPSVEGDSPCWTEDYNFWSGRGAVSRGEYEEIIEHRLSSDFDRLDGVGAIHAKIVSLTMSSAAKAANFCEATLQFKSQADAFRFFIGEESGWENYGKNYADGEFSARDVLTFFDRQVHKGTKHD